MNTRLVDYSSDEEQSSPEIKDKLCLESFGELKENEKDRQCKLLPLPSQIKDMFAENNETKTDDLEKYGGKIRSFPHERGVWATYIYIHYEAEPEFLEMIEQLKTVAKGHGIILSSIENFHVSLSRTLKLRHHWIQSLVNSLRASLRNFFKFKIMFQSVEVYENEDKTRTFIGLKVHYGFDYLCKIIEKVDLCISEFNLPVFYKSPSFHLSCASCVGNKVDQIEVFMAELNDVFVSFSESNPASRILWATDICCKTGNKLFKFPLK